MTNDKDSAVLEPCGHCGEQCATLVIDQGDKWAHYEPSCLEVRTGYDLSDDAPWRDEAIAAWNTRQPTQREEDLATALNATAAACADHVKTIMQLRAELAALRQPTQSDALREVLKTARDYVADVAEGNIHFNDNIKAMAAEDLTHIDAALQEQSK